MQDTKEKMSCGHCGAQMFNVYIRQDGSLSVKCCSCQNTTEVKINSQISLEFGKGSDGILCVL